MLVETGGLLLEVFLKTSSNYSTRRAWNRLLGNVQRNPSYDRGVEVEEIVSGARNSFYFHLLSTMASRGQSVNRQLFFITLVMKHKGLSRNGLNLFSQMNLGLSNRSFDSELVAFEMRIEQERRSPHHVCH